MSLPRRSDLPVYSSKLPSNGSDIKFRPYTVKERKVLLMALEAGDETSIVDALKQIINHCVISPENFNVDKIASFDLEYLFIKLRAKSVGEVVPLTYTCKNKVGEATCNAVVQIDLNLNNVEVRFDNKSERPNDIKFTSNSGIRMKYPTLELYTKIASSPSPTVATMDYVASCVDLVFDHETVYQAKDSTQEEIIDFLEALTVENFSKIEKWFDTIPYIKETIEKDCPKCGYHHSVVLEGLQDFFG